LAFPVLPVFLAALPFDVATLRSAWWLQGRSLRWALGGGLALFTCVWAALVGVHVVFGISGAMTRARGQLAVNRAAYQWIARNTPSEAAFLAYDDPLLYLYTGRAACRRVVPTRYFYRDDRNGVEEVFTSIPTFARDHHLQYLVTTASDWHGELLPADLVNGFNRVAETSPHQRLIFQTPMARIYRFESD